MVWFSNFIPLNRQSLILIFYRIEVDLKANQTESNENSPKLLYVPNHGNADAGISTN